MGAHIVTVPHEAIWDWGDSEPASRQEFRVYFYPLGEDATPNAPVLVTPRHNNGFPLRFQLYAQPQTLPTGPTQELVTYISLHVIFQEPVRTTAVFMSFNMYQEGADGFDIRGPLEEG